MRQQGASWPVPGFAYREWLLISGLLILVESGCSTQGDGGVSERSSTDANGGVGGAATIVDAGAGAGAGGADDDTHGVGTFGLSDTADPGDTSAGETGNLGGDSPDASAPPPPTASPEGTTPGTPPSPVCSEDTYDHDGDPSTTCQARSSCEAGEYVENEGSVNSDRICASCSPGTYSELSNATSCSPWSSCSWSEIETRAPSASADRACGPGSDYRQLQGAAVSVAVDQQGNVLVAGSGLVTKYDPSGNEVWTAQVETTFSVGGALDVYSVAVDSQNNVLVALGSFSHDATFVGKADPEGNQLWVAQVNEAAQPLQDSFVAVDSQDNVLVTSATALNPFVGKYNPDGSQVWIYNFDPGPVAYARSVAVDSAGNVVLAGDANGKLPGVAEDVAGYMFVRKYDPDGLRLWTQQFGNEVGFEEAHGVAVDSRGNVLVAGLTHWDGQSLVADAILRKYDADGIEVWTQQWEASGSQPGAHAVAVDSADNVLVVGSGAFVNKYDADGNELWTQFAATDPDTNRTAKAVAVDSQGRVFVVGFTSDAQSGSFIGGFVWLVRD